MTNTHNQYTLCLPVLRASQPGRSDLRHLRIVVVSLPTSKLYHLAVLLRERSAGLTNKEDSHDAHSRPDH